VALSLFVGGAMNHPGSMTDMVRIMKKKTVSTRYCTSQHLGKIDLGSTVLQLRLLCGALKSQGLCRGWRTAPGSGVWLGGFSRRVRQRAVVGKGWQRYFCRRWKWWGQWHWLFNVNEASSPAWTDRHGPVSKWGNNFDHPEFLRQ